MKNMELPELPDHVMQVRQHQGHPWFAAKYLRMFGPMPIAGTRLFTDEQVIDYARQCIEKERNRRARLVAKENASTAL